MLNIHIWMKMNASQVIKLSTDYIEPAKTSQILGQIVNFNPFSLYAENYKLNICTVNLY